MLTLNTYQTALANFLAAKKRLGEIVATTRDVVGLFDGWEKRSTGDFNGTFSRGMEQWPAAKTLVDAVNAWIGATDRVVQEWKAMHEDERIGLMPPEQFIAG